MPIKTINDLIIQGIKPERVHSLHKERPNPNPHFKMQEVVPPLSRGDFLNCWKEDRAELVKVKEENEKIVKERDKLRKVMQTTYSRDWPAQVSAILKEGKDEKEKK